jgi:hypothetical protein
MPTEPRSFGDLLSDGIRMLGAVWRSLVVPALGAFIPMGALTLVAFQATGGTEFFRLTLSDPDVLETMTREEFLELSLPFVNAILISIVLQAVASGFIALAVSYIVAARIEGKALTGGEATMKALARMPKLVVVGILATIGVAVGLLLLVIPGIWLAISLAMTTHVVALEDRSVIASLTRSATLVRGRWWETLGFVLLVGLMGSVAGQFLQLLALPLLAVGDISTSLALVFVAGLVLQGLVIAAIAVMTTMWYFDLRSRRGEVVSPQAG